MTDESPRREDDTRRREDASVRLEQWASDFTERYEKDQTTVRESAKAWREKHDTAHAALLEEINKRLAPFERLLIILETPAKAIGAILVLMLTPVFGMLGWDMAKWLINLLQKVFGNGHP